MLTCSAAFCCWRHLARRFLNHTCATTAIRSVHGSTTVQTVRPTYLRGPHAEKEFLLLDIISASLSVATPINRQRKGKRNEVTTSRPEPLPHVYVESVLGPHAQYSSNGIASLYCGFVSRLSSFLTATHSVVKLEFHGTDTDIGDAPIV